MPLDDDSKVPLPRLVGPQLMPFPNQKYHIRFNALLSGRSPGRHSHVFEVIIARKKYALKIFRFFDADEELSTFDHLDEVPRDKLILQMDPFYAECRAYGAIINKKRNGKVAAFCHGHISLPATYESQLAKEFKIEDWQRPDEEYSLPIAKREPFRAIVKELVTDSTPFTGKMIKHMLKDLMDLRNMYVYVRDVRADNYLGGKLVDFSSSWTAPHVLVSTYVRDEDVIELDLRWDLEQFDDMVKDAGIKTSLRAAPNLEFISKLRPRRKSIFYG